MDLKVKMRGVSLQNFTSKVTFLIKSSYTCVHENSDAQLSSIVAKSEACLKVTLAFQP